MVPAGMGSSFSSEDALRLILGGATKAANMKATMRFTSRGNDFAYAKTRAKYLFDREYGQNGAKTSLDMSHALAKAITSLKSASFTRIIRIDAQAAAQLEKNEGGRGLLPLTFPSVRDLLQLGISGADRGELFRLYLQAPTSLQPSQVRIKACSEHDHGHGVSLILPPTAGGASGAGVSLSSQVLAQLRDVAEEGFSFVEYFSEQSWNGQDQGGVSLRVAERFPLSTVVSITESSHSADAQMSALKARAKGMAALGRGPERSTHPKGANNVVCHTKIDKTLLGKVYESPEMFRYQLFSLPLLEALKRYDVADLRSILGHFFSSAVTSFVRAPTEAAMVNAWRTFASEHVGSSTVPPSPANQVLGSDFGGLFNPVELLSELTTMDSGGNTKVALQANAERGDGEDGKFSGRSNGIFATTRVPSAHKNPILCAHRVDSLSHRHHECHAQGSPPL